VVAVVGFVEAECGEDDLDGGVVLKRMDAEGLEIGSLQQKMHSI
jgi:hypothetical protein